MVRATVSRPPDMVGFKTETRPCRVAAMASSLSTRTDRARASSLVTGGGVSRSSKNFGLRSRFWMTDCARGRRVSPPQC
jgi:hypothetical protein